MPNFETFTKRLVPLGKRPYLTIQKRGIISLNQAAFLALGSPETVELLFDAHQRILGLRAVDAMIEHAYPVRRVGIGATSYVIAARAFTKHYRIDTAVSRRWPATLDTGVLCIDLKTQGTIVTGNKHTPD